MPGQTSDPFKKCSHVYVFDVGRMGVAGAEAAAPAAPPPAAAAPTAAPAAAPAAPGGDPFLAVCRWWDRECAGYLRAEDVEEVLLFTADTISRAPPGPPFQDDALRSGRASDQWAYRRCCG